MNSVDAKIKWGDDSENDDFRRFDYGLNIGTFHNRVLTFSIGYVIKE